MDAEEAERMRRSREERAARRRAKGGDDDVDIFVTVSHSPGFK